MLFRLAAAFRQPARRRKLISAIARSQKAYLAARVAVLLVIFAGVLLISLGLFISASRFMRGLDLLESGGSVAVTGPRAPAPTPTVDDWAGFIPIMIIQTPAPALAAPREPASLPAAAVAVDPAPLPDPALKVAPQIVAPLDNAPLPPALTPGPPDRLVIPVIGLDAPVVLVKGESVTVDGRAYLQWQAPEDFAAGWQEGSAQAGAHGNTVLNGHHNIHGSVFGRLYELEQGDALELRSGERAYAYTVSQVMFLEERGVGIDQRLENARWILPSDDTRLTLVTCWPPKSNTHRLIVVAIPAQ